MFYPRKLIKMNTNLGITLPTSIVKQFGLKQGETVDLFIDDYGDNVILDIKNRRNELGNSCSNEPLKDENE